MLIVRSLEQIAKILRKQSHQGAYYNDNVKNNLILPTSQSIQYLFDLGILKCKIQGWIHHHYFNLYVCEFVHRSIQILSELSSIHVHSALIG